MNKKLIIFFLLLILLYCIYLLKNRYSIIKLSKKYNKDTKFYDIDIYPELNSIDKYKNKIENELIKVLKDDLKNWSEWPEKNLYDSEKKIWKIMPFFYHDLWIDKNCKKMPNLTKFLKGLKNMKIALLSVLSPRTTLKQHKGWGSHSNNVLRCHYGLKVPNNCYMSVKNDNELFGTIKEHKKNNWLIFDDSKLHFASNNSDDFRIILIIDLERPKYIPKGESDIGDTKELLEIIKYFQKNN